MAEKKVEAEQQAAAQDEQNKDVILDNDTGKAINATDAAHAESTEAVQDDARELVEQEEDDAPKVEQEAPKPVTPQDFHDAGYDSVALDAGGIAYVSPWGLELLRAGSAKEAGLATSDSKSEEKAKPTVEPAPKLKAGATTKEIAEAYNELAERFNQLIG